MKSSHENKVKPLKSHTDKAERSEETVTELRLVCAHKDGKPIFETLVLKQSKVIYYQKDSPIRRQGIIPKATLPC